LAETKPYRLGEIMRRLRAESPFRSGAAARAALEEIMRSVEDEFSGVPENQNAATLPTDGRMYPPHDRFEVSSGSPLVRKFRQLRHFTYIGENGALRIEIAGGSVELDLPGTDGKLIEDIFSENR
jgi:hypothetical protein